MGTMVCWMLLGAPLERYTERDQDNLDFELYMLIATTKESIAKAWKALVHHPPFPADPDNTPFCLQHATCKKVWIEKWFLILGRHIHHPSEDFPLILIPDALKNMDHRGMNTECKKYILWLSDWGSIIYIYIMACRNISNICTVCRNVFTPQYIY